MDIRLTNPGHQPLEVSASTLKGALDEARNIALATRICYDCYDKDGRLVGTVSPKDIRVSEWVLKAKILLAMGILVLSMLACSVSGPNGEKTSIGCALQPQHCAALTAAHK